MSEPNQTINEELCDGTILIGYGKPGHGMNGKDADLDRIGQCRVEELRTVDPIRPKDGNMRVDIHLKLSAAVCAPTAENVNIEAIIENESEDLLDLFAARLQDPRDVDWDKDPAEAARIIENLADFYRDLAQEYILGGLELLVDEDPYTFMWNDDAWEGSIVVVLSVPLTLEEYEAIEDGCLETLEEVGKRIYREICDANQGGSEGRDRLKNFEEAVGRCNDELNKLGCYKQPDLN